MVPAPLACAGWTWWLSTWSPRFLSPAPPHTAAHVSFWTRHSFRVCQLKPSTVCICSASKGLLVSKTPGIIWHVLPPPLSPGPPCSRLAPAPFDVESTPELFPAVGPASLLGSFYHFESLGRLTGSESCPCSCATSAPVCGLPSIPSVWACTLELFPYLSVICTFHNGHSRKAVSLGVLFVFNF